MALIANDILKVVVKFSGGAWSAIQNKFNFILSGTGSATEADVLDAVQTFLEVVYENVDDYISSDIAFVEALVDVIEFIVDKWETVQTIGQILSLSGISFDATGDPLPPSTSALIRMGTMVPKHEGRKYVAGFTEDHNTTDGQANATLVTALSAMAQAIAYNSVEVPNSDLELEYVIPDIDQDIYRYADRTSATALWAQQRRRKKFVGL